jgi:serine/threonine-protein kinase
MGVCLWEMLSGARLFPGDPADIYRRLLGEPIPRASQINPDMDAVLDDIVARALEKDLERRFQTADDMREALDEHLRSSGRSVRAAEMAQPLLQMFGDVREGLRRKVHDAMAAAAAPGSREVPSWRQSAPDLPPLSGPTPEPPAMRTSTGEREKVTIPAPDEAVVAPNPAQRK